MYTVHSVHSSIGKWFDDAAMKNLDIKPVESKIEKKKDVDLLFWWQRWNANSAETSNYDGRRAAYQQYIKMFSSNVYTIYRLGRVRAVVRVLQALHWATCNINDDTSPI